MLETFQRFCSSYLNNSEADFWRDAFNVAGWLVKAFLLWHQIQFRKLENKKNFFLWDNTLTLTFHTSFATNVFFHVGCLCLRLYIFLLYPWDACSQTYLSSKTVLPSNAIKVAVWVEIDLKIFVFQINVLNEMPFADQI